LNLAVTSQRLAHCTLSLLFHCNILSSASSTSLHSGLRYPFILDPFCSNTLISLALVLHIIWIMEFTTQNSRHQSAFLFQFSICRITSTFPLMLKTFHLFVTAAMLSHYQSPVHCRSRNVEGS